MAQLTLTVPDGEVDRVVAAFEARFGERDVGGGETKADFMKRILGQQINLVLLAGEVKLSEQDTRANFTPVSVT